MGLIPPGSQWQSDLTQLEKKILLTKLMSSRINGSPQAFSSLAVPITFAEMNKDFLIGI